MSYKQDLYSSNELWYLEYAGDGYYYIRNRESALYLASASTATTANIVQSSMPKDAANRDRLLFRFIPVDVEYDMEAPAQPVGLQATNHSASVQLNWSANSEADVEGYIVVRAEKGTGDWNVIARQLAEPMFVDNTCRPHLSYVYKVKAVDKSQNISEASDSVEASPLGEPSMIARWNFEDNLYDDTPNMMDMASTSAKYVADTIAGDKCLSLAYQYVQLPYEIASSDELTVAMWVYLRSTASNLHLFDFGYDNSHYLYLTPNNVRAMSFAIRNGGDEQTVASQSKLPANQWKHVAVTIGNGKTALYVDGEEVGSATGITIRPSDVAPVLNYLGRSQSASDALMTADLDDVRIYNYALDAADVKTIMDGGQLTGIQPADYKAKAPKVFGLDGIERTAAKKGLNIIDGKKVMK
jgi:hypothetical protein